MNRAWIVAVALIIASRAWGESAYPEPPVAKQMFAITDQAIAQAQATSNPLSNFLRTSQGRYTLFPTATLIPPAAGRCNGRLRACRFRKILHLMEQRRRTVLGGGLRNTEGRPNPRHHPGRPHLFALGGVGGQGGGGVFFLSAVAYLLCVAETLKRHDGKRKSPKYLKLKECPRSSAG